MAASVTCANTNTSSDELERSAYVLMDDNSTALRVVELTGGEVFDCDNMPTLETMRRGAYVDLSPGQRALQVVPVT